MATSSKSSSSTGQGSHNTSITDARRGNHNHSAAGTAIFIGLRPLSPIAQYQNLYRGWGPWLLSKIGASTISPMLSTPGASLSRHLLLAMSTGVTAKHIYWVLALNHEYFNPPIASLVGIGHLIFDTVASLLFLSPKTSALLTGPYISIPGTGSALSVPITLGTAMFTIGLLMETVAEAQRKQFKSNPENTGKIYTKGLWALARHVNYGGYTLWSAGYMLAAGGWAAGLFVMALLTLDFYYRPIPGLDRYMTEKYGEQ
ncbi:hypothetical protein PHISCL_04713 [Aspergillus sclerotialis]|uniref:DUF1295 domain protein n=1 Tax=Aspergillus sclerotialis TaxID=2070753 RepID=A0A3A2ZUI0_9EURO|nr:hypothetical protein PHISCL_04713 [Aspergillus sclerotialis]